MWCVGCRLLTHALAEESTLKSKMFKSIKNKKDCALIFKKFAGRHSTDSMMSESHPPFMENKQSFVLTPSHQVINIGPHSAFTWLCSLE